MVQANKSWTVYPLSCRDHSINCGVTNAHNKGRASRFTRTRHPVKLAASRNDLTKQETFRLEFRNKKRLADKNISSLHKLIP